MTALTLAPGPRANDQATRLRALVNAGIPGVAQAGPTASPLPVRGLAKIITIASGKGGVGKTSLAVNLSIALAGLGCRTTLLDADLGTANADVICGLMPGARLEHVIRPGAGTRSLRDIAVDAPGGFRLVPGSAGIARMADLPATEREHLVEAISDLERGADVVVIDTGAGVGPVVLDFLLASDLALVIATPEPTAIADAYALIKCLCSARLQHRLRSVERPQSEAPVALVVNQAVDEQEARTVHARIAAVCARFLGLALPLAGSIAQDLRVATAVRSRKPLLLECPRSPAARNIQGLASALAQQMALGRDPRTDHSRHPRLSGLLARLRVC